MKQSLTILFKAHDAIGHMNACIGVAQVLQQSGHRIVFAVNEQWREKLSVYGFEEELFTDPETDPNSDAGSTEDFSGALIALSPIKKIKIISNGFNAVIIRTIRMDRWIEDVLNRCKPDIIVIDSLFVNPPILKSRIPWVLLWSASPLSFHLNNDNFPPAFFGLPINGERNEWKEMRALFSESFQKSFDAINEWLSEYECEKRESNSTNSLVQISPYLNIYNYPEEIDYVKDITENFQRFDNFMRSEKTSQFEVPEELRDKSGKLVYFSLGSIGSANVELMKRLVLILSKSKHRFIVSKGEFHSQYSLYANMWGEKTVPQTKVLPIVDLVITHGGNNTVTESFYFGKPMILMPFFADGYDNAQRIHETGYGIRLDPYNCSETELLEAIETLLNDEELAMKLNKMKKRIQSSNKLAKVVDMIEKLAKKD